MVIILNSFCQYRDQFFGVTLKNNVKKIQMGVECGVKAVRFLQKCTFSEIKNNTMFKIA